MFVQPDASPVPDEHPLAARSYAVVANTVTLHPNSVTHSDQAAADLCDVTTTLLAK